MCSSKSLLLTSWPSRLLNFLLSLAYYPAISPPTAASISQSSCVPDKSQREVNVSQAGVWDYTSLLFSRSEPSSLRSAGWKTSDDDFSWRIACYPYPLQNLAFCSSLFWIIIFEERAGVDFDCNINIGLNGGLNAGEKWVVYIVLEYSNSGLPQLVNYNNNLCPASNPRRKRRVS